MECSSFMTFDRFLFWCDFGGVESESKVESEEIESEEIDSPDSLLPEEGNMTQSRSPSHAPVPLTQLPPALTVHPGFARPTV